MRFGARMPSVGKRISSRTSLKRYARHTLGVKAPRGAGLITNPKRAVYNRVYNRTSISVDRLARSGSGATGRSGAQTTKLPTTQLSLAQPLADFMYQHPSSLTISLWKLGTSANRARALVAESVRCFDASNYQEALQLAQQAYETDPHSVEALYLIGACSNNLGDLTTAAEYLERYVAQVYGDLHARYVLGIVYVQVGDAAKAKELAKGLVLELGYQLEAVRLLGLANLKNEDYDNAVAAFNRAPLKKKIDSETLLDIHYWLGAAYENMGDMKRAHKEYQRVSEINATFRDVAAALSRTE